MVLPGPLQRLHDLDRNSPQFQEQFSNFLRGNEYQSVVSDLEGEDLVWLIGYLDSVCLQDTSPSSGLTIRVGSHQYF